MDATLQSVNFTDASGEALDGLVSVASPPEGILLDEVSVIRKLSDFPDVNFVFFRRFSDGRSSQPAALVVDNRDQHLDNKALAKLHNDLWMHGVAPLVYVNWPTRIDILSCARGPDFWIEDELKYHPAAQLEIASSIDSELAKKRNFSAYRLADGTFWDDPQNHPLAQHEKAAHESLIQAIVETDLALDGTNNPIQRRLLLLMVLIKYLEDREVFPGPGWFGRFHKGARKFFDVIEGGEPESVLSLLRTLEERFNGDVFALPVDMKLTKSALRQFAKLVEARTIKQQRYLWEQYSFAHLPVEVISHLYQRFVAGSTAVYTPPFLASLLLDYAMPYERLTGKERVLDPACGSGVFLVGAFRRLVAVYRAKHKKAPGADSLKAILKNQIFGVETDANAVDLTAFSLALAVCDSLQPNVIWNELRFDRLRGQNVVESDFFAFKFDDPKSGVFGTFDVVIGNPPFESDFSEAADIVNKAWVPLRGTIPDKQIAYLFLEHSIRQLKESGRICMIQPKGFLYNRNVQHIREHISTIAVPSTIIDLTSIRNLYSGADPKTVAVIATRGKSHPNDVITHLVFRRTFNTSNQLGFEIDHYDQHNVTVEELATEPFIWKANLIGGGRIIGMVKRLMSHRTLKQYVDENEWISGEGFIEGTSGKPAPHLTGQPLVDIKALQTGEIARQKLKTLTSTIFYRSGNPNLFHGPLVMLGEHESLPSAFWDGKGIAYSQRIVGIRGNNSDRPLLRNLLEVIHRHNNCFRFFVAAVSPQYLLDKATAITKGDIERIPFPVDPLDLELTFWEEAIASDVADLIAPFIRLGQNSTLLQQHANLRNVSEYSQLYCNMLRSIYDNLRASPPIFLNGLICQPFYFGKEPAIDWLGPNCEEHLNALVFDNSRESLRTIRVVRYYHENVVFIIKPDRLRYWIKSTAIRDADDTLVDLQRQGF
jgi:hypothetical protein